MKLTTKPKADKTEKPPRKKPGPEPSVGGSRVNFFPGDSLDLLPKLNKFYKRMGVPPITQSFALREAVRPWLQSKIKEAKAADGGKLHAKSR